MKINLIIKQETWNSFLFPGHFSVQAFFLTEIGPVPWNRVNKLLSCSLLFHQGWIGYAGTHVPMFVHKLGLIKPRQT